MTAPARLSRSALLALVGGAVLSLACGQRRQAPHSVAGPAPGSAAPPATPPPIGTAPGQRAPPFAVVTPDGQRVSSAELTEQGKPFILYFFATW